MPRDGKVGASNEGLYASESWEEFRVASADGDGVAQLIAAALKADLDQDILDKRPGHDIAERRSGALDHVIETLTYDKANIAIAAVGGYGRGRLAPYSDVDLLILTKKGQDPETLPIDQILYPLWDAGLTVGSAVHTPSSAISRCRENIITCTAYLESQLVAGDDVIYREFLARFDQYRRRSTKRFCRAKMSEFDKRRSLHGTAASRLEPDLKEGRGGLRDLDTVGWIYRYLYGRDAFDTDELSPYLSTEESVVLRRARDRLWGIRVYLHYLRGRQDDRVSFEVQPELADALGYADRRKASAAERLMKRLRINTNDVNRLSRILLSKFEERTADLSFWVPKATPTSIQRDEYGPRVNVTIRSNRLDFLNRSTAKETPSDLFRIFRAQAKRKGLDLHPEALQLISSQARSLPATVAQDPALAAVTLSMLENARSPLPVLYDMSETGLLGKQMPFLRRITGNVEYGLYRRFSTEETIFHSLDAFSEIRYGDLGEDHPITASLLKRKSRRRATLLAILLQELSWVVGSEPAIIEKEANQIAKRFGLNDMEAADAAWCAARPDLLMDVAERQNIGVDETLYDFGRTVGTISRLETLLALTVTRHLAISDRRWNAWTRRQTGILYYGARAAIAGGRDGVRAFQREERMALTAALRNAVPEWSAEIASDYSMKLASSGAARLPPELLVRGAKAFRAATTRDSSRSGEQSNIAIDVSLFDEGGDAVVCVPDRRRLLCDLCAAV
ncbi:MAG: nucleotidyltransferase domain-containing protein, partial [Pseudomonadota bacterium]